MRRSSPNLAFFFFNDTATTEIYTLSLHDALPISLPYTTPPGHNHAQSDRSEFALGDRKSTRLNSSHTVISYAVFCLKKKKIKNTSLAYDVMEMIFQAFNPTPRRLKWCTTTW